MNKKTLELATVLPINENWANQKTFVSSQHPDAEGIIRRQKIAEWCKKYGIPYYNKTENFVVQKQTA